MPKYLFEARYSPEGAMGLAKEGGTSRARRRQEASRGSRRQAGIMYFAFGDVDCFAMVELPDNISAAAIALAVNESGMSQQGDRAVHAGGNGHGRQTKVHFLGRDRPIPTRFQLARRSCYGGRASRARSSTG